MCIACVLTMITFQIGYIIFWNEINKYITLFKTLYCIVTATSYFSIILFKLTETPYSNLV